MQVLLAGTTFCDILCARGRQYPDVRAEEFRDHPGILDATAAANSQEVQPPRAALATVAAPGSWRIIPSFQRQWVASGCLLVGGGKARDRKSTRLNSSHSSISYAVFCLKKKRNSASS